ncbi:MAG: hypothetical protein ACLQVK_12835 [Acidimicrobiales bacterium]
MEPKTILWVQCDWYVRPPIWLENPAQERVPDGHPREAAADGSWGWAGPEDLERYRQAHPPVDPRTLWPIGEEVWAGLCSWADQWDLVGGDAEDGQDWIRRGASLAAALQDELGAEYEVRYRYALSTESDHGGERPERAHSASPLLAGEACRAVDLGVSTGSVAATADPPRWGHYVPVSLYLVGFFWLGSQTPGWA